MNTEIAAFVRRHALFPPNALVLCAVSGGADSVSLLHVLHGQQEALGIRVAAAHYNHGIRPTAARDEQFVRDLCAKWGIPCHCGHGDVPVGAAESGESLELTARRMRYDFLEQTADAIGASVIATAHTADDNLETVLMNLCRGTGAAGAAGIPPRRGRIVRPMLSVTRRQVETYLRQQGLDHMEDETNGLDCCTRNRVRHRAVPVLKEVNPRAAEHVQAASERLRADNELLEQLARQTLLDKGEREGDGLWLETKILNQAPEPLAVRAILLLCRELGADTVDAGKVRDVLQLSGKAHPSGRLDLGGGIEARRSYERLWIGPREEPRTFEPRILTVPGETCVPELGINVLCRIQENGEKVHNSFLFYTVGCGTIRGTLVLRPRQQGDTIRLEGRPEKSLKKLFTELKIPRHRRQSVPVIADENGVVAVAGVGSDVRCHPGAGPVLEIQVQYGGSSNESGY